MPRKLFVGGGSYGIPQRPSRSFGPITIKAWPIPFWVLYTSLENERPSLNFYTAHITTSL